MDRRKISKTLQELVRKRAKGYCEYCLITSSFSPDTFPLDHIIPISQGGKSVAENLALACGGCNAHKHAKTDSPDPLTFQKARLFHPRKDAWGAHFQWNEDDTMIVGITPIGRATVGSLQMNREANVNLRRLLILAGLHPPKVYPEK